jgi:dimethylamine monooxygenase subunit A
MDVVLQAEVPQAQMLAAQARLPQVYPVPPGDWLRMDNAYAAQLALKAALIYDRRAEVIAVLPGAVAAVAELLDLVLAELAGLPGFDVGPDRVQRPDGIWVDLDRADPFLTLSRLVQEDFCIHQKIGAEHVLTAALLAFPAAWTLAEKIGHPLSRIHAPVGRYDPDIAARVQRMFDMITPGRVLWRANLLRYDDPALFQPHREAAPRAVGRADSPYLRSERQCILRLPVTGAVVFSIHTTMVRAVDQD